MVSLNITKILRVRKSLKWRIYVPYKEPVMIDRVAIR